jgi:hypothetical protein
VIGLQTKFWAWLTPYLPLEIGFGIVAALVLLATPMFATIEAAAAASVRFRCFGFIALLAMPRWRSHRMWLIAGTPICRAAPGCRGIAVFISSFAHPRDAAIPQRSSFSLLLLVRRSSIQRR